MESTDYENHNYDNLSIFLFNLTPLNPNIFEMW